MQPEKDSVEIPCNQRKEVFFLTIEKYNLFSEPWIPVRDTDKNNTSRRKFASLREVLVSGEKYELVNVRDDFSMYQTEMLACLVQAAFLPRDNDELLKRIQTPMEGFEYDRAVSMVSDNFDMSWFDLLHDKYPFMQHRDIPKKNPDKAEDAPVNKIIPEYATRKFHFNNPNSITHVCPSCAATALFIRGNYAYGGGAKHKMPFRKGAISTYIYDGDLRKAIWKNVLPASHPLVSDIREICTDREPVWVKPPYEETVYVHTMGLLRGEFWIPDPLYLDWEQGRLRCSVCGMETGLAAVGAHVGVSLYEKVVGTWISPFSPYIDKYYRYAQDLESKKKMRKPGRKTGTRRKKPEVQFTVVKMEKHLPFWSFLNSVFPPDEAGKWSASVKNYLDLAVELGDKSIQLSIGGYAYNDVKEPNIKQRRHEIIPILSPAKDLDKMRTVVALGMEIAKILENKAFGVAKYLEGEKYVNKYKDNKGFIFKCLSDFYNSTEFTMYRWINEFPAVASNGEKTEFLFSVAKTLTREAEKTFRKFTCHLAGLKAEKTVCMTENALRKELARIRLRYAAVKENNC